MRRLLAALLCASCTVVDPSDMRERVDADVDGVPLGSDCNDQPDGAGFANLQQKLDGQPEEGPCAAPLTCGSRVSCRLPLETEAPMHYSTCQDPGAPNRVLTYGARSFVHRLEVGDAPEVVVRVRPVQGDQASEEERAQLFQLPSEDMPPEIVLMANRGRTCGFDTCELGYPLRRGAEETDGQDAELPSLASVWLLPSPDEPWYVVVSADTGRYTIEMACP